MCVWLDYATTGLWPQAASQLFQFMECCASLFSVCVCSCITLWLFAWLYRFCKPPCIYIGYLGLLVTFVHRHTERRTGSNLGLAQEPLFFWSRANQSHFWATVAPSLYGTLGNRATPYFLRHTKCCVSENRPKLFYWNSLCHFNAEL